MQEFSQLQREKLLFIFFLNGKETKNVSHTSQLLGCGEVLRTKGIVPFKIGNNTVSD